MPGNSPDTASVSKGAAQSESGTKVPFTVKRFVLFCFVLRR